MNTLVQSSLTDVESRLNALLTSLTTSPTAAGAPAAALALLEADDALTSAIETLRQHQINHAKILRLRNEAQQLEEKVKGIVSDIDGFDKAIRTVCADNGDSDSDFDSDSDNEIGGKQTALRGIKEIDYKLILDFARRISKYNHEAAADVATGAAGKRQESGPQTGDKDVNMSGTNGEQLAEDGAEPVSSVTKSATQWLDESANVTREVYMLPYPMEERIRMGLMAQIQLAPGGDPDREMERLLAEADGRGVAEPPALVEPTESTKKADEAAKAAANAGSSAGKPRAPAPVSAPAPAPKPKATLDLDLYDPDDDDD
ncbi:uncharacterized protein N7511_007007 [Penicillium nucicola]|uniref:uncharacterized protein n=1 Tax=Penicillium nucicola TaxID=1850975 RepID=UPI0025455241|nr:uncharacterized protein N7511_007007 [Penicillium nucicola]KAJ5758313.1 hypothetical protein N7511_007007 [Penicillium nucicola]